MTTLHTWAQAGPDTAEGIARREDHEDVVDILHQLNAVALGQAMQAHPAPAGAHPVHFTVV